MYLIENDGTKNLVSILIASLREEELKKRLEEYKDIEINHEIIVISPFEVIHPKVKWIKEEERKGNVYAMQKAFENSIGNYIIFLADDVSPTPYAIDNLFHFVRMRGEPFLGSFIMTEENGKEQDCWYIKDKLYACYGCIARKHIKQIGGFFDTEYKHSWCDPDLAMRVWSNVGKVEICPTAIVINRQIHDEIYKENSSHYFEQDTNTFRRKWSTKLGFDVNASWNTFNKSFFTLEERNNHIQMDKCLAIPYKETDNPILSCLLSCRVFNSSEFIHPIKCDMDRTDRFNLYTFFDSFIYYNKETDYKKIEFLVKFDSDNELALNEYIYNNKLSEKYPQLIIRPFIFGRWEGRNSLYDMYEFLFTRRNLSSRFVTFASDDSLFYNNHNGGGNIFEILKINQQEDYVLLTSHNKQDLWDSIEHWKKDTNKWRDGWLTEPYPIVSVKLMEIMGNMGFQNNIDSSFTLLAVMLKCKYNIDIRRLINGWMLRGNKKVETDNYNTAFNEEFCISIDQVPQENSYFWKLVEQQTSNIYLQMGVKNGMVD